jgi:hypothetical protein
MHHTVIPAGERGDFRSNRMSDVPMAGGQKSSSKATLPVTPTW